MRDMQQSVCKAGNANVLQRYDNQVPRDVCLMVVSGCLFESVIAADRSVCVCVCVGGWVQFVWKKKMVCFMFYPPGVHWCWHVCWLKLHLLIHAFLRSAPKLTWRNTFFLFVFVLSPYHHPGNERNITFVKILKTSGPTCLICINDICAI